MGSVVYSYPPKLVFSLARDVLFMRMRSFRADAVACTGRLKPPLRILGEENIPQRGPCVVTVNHYYRPGFQAWWIAFGISACVPVVMHWVMTGELTFPGKWYAPAGRSVSKFILARLARVYGFTSMPPMPPRPKDVTARALAVRETLDIVQTRKDVILGLAPEGGDQPAGKLSMPASGAGRFGLLLAGTGSVFVPVGAYELEGEFCLHFGEAYQLRVPPNLTADDRDRLAAKMMMERIAALLPPGLKGEFA